MNILTRLMVAAGAAATLATPLAAAAQGYHHGAWRGGYEYRVRGDFGWRGHYGWSWRGGWGPGVYAYPGPVVWGGPVVYGAPPVEQPYYPPPPAPIVYERRAPAPVVRVVHRRLVRHVVHHAISCRTPHA